MNEKKETQGPEKVGKGEGETCAGVGEQEADVGGEGETVVEQEVWRLQQKDGGEGEEAVSLPMFLVQLRDRYADKNVVTNAMYSIIPFSIPKKYVFPSNIEGSLRDAGLEGTFRKPDMAEWQHIVSEVEDHYNMIVQGWEIGGSVHGYTCDYCKCKVVGEEDHFGDFYYCDCCAKDMCKLCFSERSEDDAERNNAKNYAARKEALQKCFLQHPQHLKGRCVPTQFMCDCCYAELYEPHFWYSGEWGKDIKLVDLCDKCWKKSETVEVKCPIDRLAPVGTAERAAQLRVKHKIVESEEPRLTLKRLQNLYPFFPSIVDWIPIAQDGEEEEEGGGSYLIANGNPDSALFGRVGFLLRDEGAFRWQYVTDDLVTLLEKVALTKNRNKGCEDELLSLTAKDMYGFEL